MSGKPSREELLNALWEAYVFSDCPDADRSDRQKAAFEVLRTCRKSYEEAEANGGRLADALFMHNQGKAIWTILATDLADWLVRMPGVLGRKGYWSDHTEGNERAA